MREVIGVIIALSIAGCPTTTRGTTPVDHGEAARLGADPEPPSPADLERDDASTSSTNAAAEEPAGESLAEAPCVPGEPRGPGEPITLTGDIVFDIDDREIRRESFPVLDALSDTLRRETRFCRVEIVVHAMRPEYPRGQQLGRIRADSIRQYLVERGIEVARLHSAGLDDAERRDDRRVEIVGHTDGCPCPPVSQPAP
jgi:outer membrane protein OmpA-like peptidoglycan-associated protein